MSRNVRSTVVLAAILIAVGGCTTIGSRLETVQVLSAAGLERKLPDTPDKAATLRTLPRMLVPQPGDGQLHYVYADPKGCGCLYVGTEKDYQGLAARARRQAAEGSAGILERGNEPGNVGALAVVLM